MPYVRPTRAAYNEVVFRFWVLLASAATALLAGCAPRGSPAPDFTLVADSGAPWTLSAQRGKAVLLTFGFSHCADTCPATLAKLAHLAKTRLGARASDVEIVMVTVDPKRDTPAVLHDFVGRFDGPVVGLTGTPSRIRGVERAYHVWAQPLPPKRGGGYDVVHGAEIYLIDAGGRLRGVREDDESEAAIAGAVRAILG